MKLRRLEKKDAPFMLEWMHDEKVVRYLQTDFQRKNITDCIDFIQKSQGEKTNIHLAIADNDDEYQGTVSLKHIADQTAEFAITIRYSAMGKKIAKCAMEEIIAYGFEKRNLLSIYWCVNPKNMRAVHFYDKNGYRRCSCPKNIREYTVEQRNTFIWYEITQKEWNNKE